MPAPVFTNPKPRPPSRGENCEERCRSLCLTLYTVALTTIVILAVIGVVIIIHYADAAVSSSMHCHSHAECGPGSACMQEGGCTPCTSLLSETPQCSAVDGSCFRNISLRGENCEEGCRSYDSAFDDSLDSLEAWCPGVPCSPEVAREHTCSGHG